MYTNVPIGFLSETLEKTLNLEKEKNEREEEEFEKKGGDGRTLWSGVTISIY